MADVRNAHRPDDMLAPSLWPAVRAVLAPLASLRLTVALFAMAIFIVFAGTLGQVDKDIWEVIGDYFRMPAHLEAYTSDPWGWFHAAFAKIELRYFAPTSFFPNAPDDIDGYFYFPKGWLIGFAMAVNLLAAHGLRFRVQASGSRLAAGALLLAVGGLVTFLVIRTGSMANDEGVQGEALFTWGTIWLWIKLGLACLWFVQAYAAVTLDPTRTTLRKVLIGCAAVLGVMLLAFFFYSDRLAPGDASMRILWQLIKATFAGLVLLAGCILVFRQRAGIVLLHGGVGLLMFSELLVGTSAVETTFRAQEGQSKNFVENLQEVELAVVDRSASDTDQVTVVPQARLIGDETIRDELLPFDIKVKQWIVHAPRLRDATTGDANPATAGFGKKVMPVRERRSKALDPEAAFDMPAIYAELTEKESGRSLGTYLFPVYFQLSWIEDDNSPERITVGGKTYDVALRYERAYKPYWIEVLSATSKVYEGTATPKDFASVVNVRNAAGEILLEERRIWMNNPLRYAGETFYQQSFSELAGGNHTAFQVVSNGGWMIPYVSCMIVGVGMLFHFGLALVRFVGRRQRSGESGLLTYLMWDRFRASPTAPPPTAAAAKAIADSKSRRRAGEDSAQESVWRRRLRIWLPPLVVVVAAALVARAAMPPRTEPNELDLAAFGRLPVMDQGRAKPIDSLARDTLRVMGKRQSYKDEAGETQSAVRWLLDVATRSPRADADRVYYIENLELKQLLNLEKRKGHLYARAEFKEKFDNLQREVERIQNASEAEKQRQIAAEEDGEPVRPRVASVYERQVMDLVKRIRIGEDVASGFQRSEIDAKQAKQAVMQLLRAKFGQQVEPTDEELKTLAAIEAAYRRPTSMRPLPIYRQSADGKGHWETLERGWMDNLLAVALAEFPPGTTTVLSSMLPPPQGEKRIVPIGTPAPQAEQFAKILTAYRESGAVAFNEAVAAYRESIDEAAPADYVDSHTDFEAFFSRFDPFTLCASLYLAAFILAALAWLGWADVLNRTAFWLILFTFVLHNAALVARMMISGRPPITNLYTTAIFIGWGSVLLGIAFEAIYRLGFGNIVAGMMGFATLLIAGLMSYAPGDRGDTFAVLQAVLDTQFWLATHVVSVNMGYAATFLAGALGLIYVVRGLVTPSLTADDGKMIARMIYGTLCFAIFFSFVGTVLGGLWADDSWGRFWGWDAKENGALMIVLWNALVLHARWGGMVKDRGLAVLAIGGNIITAWSYFGTNELGIGLHSYGRTEGVATSLLIFWCTQLALIAAGSLPKKYWWSFRTHGADS